MAITAVNHKPQIDSQDVGLIFVHEYYTFLNKKPHRLHAFYGKDSLFTRGDEGVSVSTAKGQEEIRKMIEECHFDDCKILVTQVDSQVSAGNGILIQVLGEMCNKNSPSQKFSQTFFLAPQTNGYYVLNDIFRFLKDEVEIDYNNYEEPTPVQQPAAVSSITTTAENSPIVHAKPIESIPVSPVSTPKVAPQHIPKQAVVESKKEEPPKKEEVKVEEPTKKTSAEPAPEPAPPVVVEEKQKKKSETKKSESKQSQQKHQHEKSGMATSPSSATTTPVVKENNKPSTPKTWANLTATAASTNGTPVTTPKPAAATAAAAAVPNVKHQQEEKVVTPNTPATTTAAPTNNNEKPQQQQNKQQQNNRKDVTQIFVKLVTEAIHEEQLIEAFSKIGQVKSCTISRGRNCAFVDFSTPEACQKALAQHKFQVSGGHTVLAEERRFNHQNNQNNNNRYNQNRNNQNQTFDQRRSNNRRQNNNQQQRQNNQTGGKGRTTVNQQQQQQK